MINTFDFKTISPIDSTKHKPVLAEQRVIRRKRRGTVKTFNILSFKSHRLIVGSPLAECYHIFESVKEKFKIVKVLKSYF